MSLNGMRQMPGEKRAAFLNRCRAAQALDKASREYAAMPKLSRKRRTRFHDEAEDQSIGDYEMYGSEREMGY